MANTKVIAIVAVVIIVAAGAGAAVFMLNNSSDSKYVSTDSTGRLQIMGNANNDDYLDSKDLSTIDAIIDGTLDFKDYPMADANNDKQVTKADRDMVERMIKREAMTINYIDGNDTVKSVKYPLNRVVVVGSNAMMTMQALGAVTAKKVVGVTGEASKDYFLFSDVKDLPKVSTSVLAADYDAVTKIGNVDAIITMASLSYIKNETTFTKAGIDVVRISSSDGMKAISVALTMGYLLGLEDRANDYAKFCDDVLKFISEKKEKIPEASIKTVLTGTMTNYVSGTTSDYYSLTVMCGAKNLADWNDSTKRFNEGDEWLLNEKYNCDLFIHYHQYTYDPSEDLTDMYMEYRSYYEDAQFVKDGHYFMINSNMPAIVRLAYTAQLLNPEIFGEDYGDVIHQQYVDKFLDNLSKDHYDVKSQKFILMDKDFNL